ncbi:TIR domain-containing protein [Candidatus Villigracilis affinis]|uniref:TIR domain-containing protein n=1 Tax=Candidatus Villigracilis affinis TaxID=3140682 RepID=UPI001D257009|nr:TIR domain-containing protein [Anaerolineales bacterium]
MGIEESDVFVFLISPDSVASEVCNVEIGHAAKNNKRIIPIVLRDVDPKTVNPIVRDLNWIFIREQDDFNEGLEKIKVAITLDIEWVQEHRRLQVRALEWERKKDPSLLLRGNDLRSARRMLATAEKNDPKPSNLQLVYIDFSYRNETRRTTFWIAAATALLIMIVLSITAVYQSRKASANEKLAQEQKILAQKNEKLAQKNAEIAQENADAAIKNQEIAEKNQVIAEAQRNSAARADLPIEGGRTLYQHPACPGSMRRSPVTGSRGYSSQEYLTASCTDHANGAIGRYQRWRLARLEIHSSLQVPTVQHVCGSFRVEKCAFVWTALSRWKMRLLVPMERSLQPGDVSEK